MKLSLLIVSPWLVLASTAGQAATITLVNNSWNNLSVDIRVGPSQNCDQNGAQAPLSIPRGSSSAVEVGTQNLCYRRDLNPDQPTGTWTNWVYIPNFGHDDSVTVN